MKQERKVDGEEILKKKDKLTRILGYPGRKNAWKAKRKGERKKKTNKVTCMARNEN